MKNQKGITLVSLVITIIVLLILASITVNVSLETIRSSNYMAFKTEMQLLQTKVDEIYSSDKDNLSNYGVDMTTDQKEIFNVSEVDEVLSSKDVDIDQLEQGFKYFSESYLVDDLKIEGITRDYYINMNKRIIIATEPVEYDGVKYYMLEQMPDGTYNVNYNTNIGDITFSYSSKVTDGNKGIIYISDIKAEGNIEKWQIRYKRKNADNWNITNEFIGNSYEINVDKISEYEVQVFHGEDLNSSIVNISIGVPDEPEDSELVEIEKDYGVIEVAFLKGTSYEISSVPNEPVLKDGMKAVYWLDGKEITQGDSDFDITYWYNYVAQTADTASGGSSYWANAKVTVDGVDSYFVWIPRYAYRIVYFDSETNENNYRDNGNGDETGFSGITGYSDARGMVDENGRKPTGVASKRGISVNEKYFVPHPAFETDVDMGGWNVDDENLTGFWVAKYESSRGPNNKPSSIPNVENWKESNIGEMYTVAQNFNTNLNSHMLKNSEWGAVAYLADSKFGRNGTEIVINNSSTYVTGNSGGTYDAPAKEEITYAYDTPEGGLASTTGNIYGIYDMSGSAWEFVSSYYNNSDTTNNDLYKTNASSFASKGGTSNNFTTVYESTDITKAYIPGDASYETSGWNKDYFGMYNSNFPFFSRGGFYEGYEGTGTDLSGIFAFGASKGNEYNSDSFRMALTVQ